MDIGFTGSAVVVLRKPIDDEEPTRLFVDLLSVNEAGIAVSFEDSEEEKRTCFIPFSNIKCIEKAEPPAAEDELESEASVPEVVAPQPQPTSPGGY